MSLARHQGRGASRDRVVRKLLDRGVVQLSKPRTLGPTEVDVEVGLGSLGEAYEILVKRQGLALHKRVGRIDLAWFHTLHKQWRRLCRQAT